MDASKMALFFGGVAAIAGLLVVPEVRCTLKLPVPTGECRASRTGSETPRTPHPAPKVDTVVIHHPVMVPPVPNSPKDKPEGPTSGVLPIQMIRLLTEADLQGKSKQELDIMRNEIYAHHGRAFDRPDLQQYFGQFNWYRPIYSPRDFDAYYEDNLLTGIQQWNADFLLRHERSRR